MFSGSIKYEMSVIILEKALLVSFRFFTVKMCFKHMTSTLIEGLNMPAKIIFIYKLEKGL